MPPKGQVRLRPLASGTDISLSDLLNRLDNDPNDEFALRDFEEIFGDVEADEGFRSSSASLQSRQDRHLKRFVKVMRIKNFRDTLYGALSDDDVIAREVTDATKEDVIKNLRLYLRAEVRLMKPRGTVDQRPRYQSLLQCRESMLFWILRQMGERAPYRWQLINASNETLQRIGRELGLNRQRSVKSYFGRLELAQLIDFDTLQSPYLPVTESHHLAWCLGCVCGIRPGSIGWSRHHKDQFLSFGDVEILRGRDPGEFHARINFRFLKGNRDSLEIETGLKFAVNGATTTDLLPMSIPHRILVILLRRNGLKDHSTLESLLSGRERFISIKDEMLPKPVCRAGGPRGLSITEEALGADSMSQYLQQHAMQAGYPSNITMYAWRRKAGSQWSRTQGSEKAKAMMGHDTRSTTLEKYYDQGLFDTPVFELAMRGDTNLAAATLDEDSSEILMRMIDNKRVKGAYLARRVQEILEGNEEYEKAVEENNVRVINNIKRRAIKLASKILHDQQKKDHDATMTVEEFERRKETVADPTGLAQLIRERTRVAMRGGVVSVGVGMQPETSASAIVAAHGSTTQGAARDPGARPAGQPPGREIGHGAGPATLGTPRGPSMATDDPEFNELLQDQDLTADDLHDAEDDFGAADQGEAGIPVDVDGQDQYGDVVDETPEAFATAVEVFMASLGQDRFVERDPSQELICELCAASPYVGDEFKEKIWTSKAKLLNHQLGREHSKHGEVMKKLKWNQDNSADGKFHCPYAGCSATYTNINKLTEHIRTSGPPSNDVQEEADRQQLQQHDDEKRADGWYDDDFETSMKESKSHIVRQNRRRVYGLAYSDMEELPEPVKIKINVSYEAVLGDIEGASMKQIPDQYKGIIAFGDDPTIPPYKGWQDLPGQPHSVVLALGDDPVAPDYEHPMPASDRPKHGLLGGDDDPKFKHPHQATPLE
ncbi:hypothetical protein PV10_06424 [Exophiala mesophila]|uniref:Uncharacterized protein n=1 Tax=Exophiala mesophila TaxID=212818 RepID=A0A0D1ZB72_EXOME|nr:uncharacterized protein PV10_06424 [Exophiala mesophila]KIV91937.1 hypothetical protein PV10_06424 [Exophiala mesophila]